MEEICSTMHDKYQRIAQSQDRIGWRRFMEGMVSKELVSIQWEYLVLSGSSMTVDRWMSGLITKLLEVTHGQWLYRNIQVHDIVSGVWGGGYASQGGDTDGDREAAGIRNGRSGRGG